MRKYSGEHHMSHRINVVQSWDRRCIRRGVCAEADNTLIAPFGVGEGVAEEAYSGT
jgi:hypothetical protein